MSDDTDIPEKPEFKADVLKGDDAALFECMKCGTTLSHSSDVCQVCGAEVSGGGWEHPEDAEEHAEE